MQSEIYMNEAWQIFTDLTYWMGHTTILTVNGVDITFMNLLWFGVVFDLILALIGEILPGWLGRERSDEMDISYNPMNTRESDDNDFVYGESAHGWSSGRWERF